MRPILLSGQTRALTKVTYNRDGDLLFSASKDHAPSVWFAHNGERLGTFEGHKGTVWDLCVSRDSKHLMTGAADSTCRLWSVDTGAELFSWPADTAVRSVAIAAGDKKALFVTDQKMGHPCYLNIVSLAPPSLDTLLTVAIQGNRITIARWGPLNAYIVAGHDNGKISVLDPDTGAVLRSCTEQSGSISDIQFGHERAYFVSSSKDHSAVIYDCDTLEVIKRFEIGRPCNAAAISPIRPHV